jgi:uncharacterized protein (UPF0335 family)
VKDVNAELIRAAVAEIEEIEADIRSHMEDRKTAYAKAQAQGLDVKVLKRLIRDLRQDQAQLDLFEDQLSSYRRAMGR